MSISNRCWRITVVLQFNRWCLFSVLTELKLQDQYEVRWNSVIDITLYNNSKTSRLLRYITWGKGTPLKRGYEEATWEDGKRIISHLILVVHGIGQKGYENLIAKNSEQWVFTRHYYCYRLTSVWDPGIDVIRWRTYDIFAEFDSDWWEEAIVGIASRYRRIALILSPS